MSTRIIPQTIITHPDDPKVQLSIVKAELERQNAQRTSQQDEALRKMCEDIRANTAYMEQVRSSRNRLLKERRNAYAARRKTMTVREIVDNIAGPLIVLWALFWLAGEKLGLWTLRRGHVKGTLPRPTRLGRGIYIALSIAFSVWFYYNAAQKIIAYIHYLAA